MLDRFLKPLLATLLLLGTAVHAQDNAGQPTVRRIYVPVEDLDAVLNRDNKGVLLPLDELEELETLAAENAGDSPNTPEGLVLSAADYEARVDGEQLLVTITARFTNFADGWMRLTIPAAGLGVESVALDGEPARIARSPENGDNLLLYVSEPGPHSVTIEAAAVLNSIGSDKVAGFATFATPTGQLRMTVPAGSYLSIGGLEIERPAPVEEEAVYEVPIGGSVSGDRRIELRLSDRQSTASGDAFVLANTAFGVYVAPGEVTWRALTSLQVFGRTIDRLVCSVPNTLEITDVQSNGLESWELADSEDGERIEITLTYRQPFSENRSVTFSGVVTTSPGQPWTVPNLIIGSVASHVGRAVVNYNPGTRVQLTQSSGVRPVLPETAMDPAAPSLEYEVWEQDFLLSFITASKEREVHAAMTTLLDVNAEGLDLYVTLDVRTLFAPLFDVRLRIPADWIVTSAAIAGQQADWRTVPLEAGVHDIRIPLTPPLGINETRQITIAAHRDLDNWPVEQEPVRFALPEVRLPQAGVIEALYGVTADGDLEIAPIEINGLDPAGSEDVALLNSKLAPLGKQVRLGFTYQDTVFTGQLEASRKPSRISAGTVTFFRIDPETLFSHLEAHLTIEGGGVRELQVAVSESAGTDLRFQLIRPFVIQAGQVQSSIYPPVDAVRIVEQRPADPADGMRTWTLALDRRARGDLVLLVDVQTPRDAAAETYSPFRLNVLTADRQTGHVAIEAGNEQYLEITATTADGRPLQTVDPVDFPPSYYIPAERVVAGYQYVHAGWQMSIAPTSYRDDREPVPTAVVHRAEIKSVLGKTGDFQHQADLTLTAVGVQNLKLRLPGSDDGAPAELWATLVDGNPVEVRRAADGVLITLPPVSDPEQQRTVTLSYHTKVAPLDESSGHLRQSPPQLSAISGNGKEQPLVILDQQWTLYHSGETLIVESDGRFHPTGELDRGSLLGRLEQTFSAPSPRDIWSGVIAVAITIVVLWVLSLGFRNYRILGVVVGVLILGCVLFVLLLPATQQAREAAQRTQVENDYWQRGTATHDYDTDAASPMVGGAGMPAAESVELDSTVSQTLSVTEGSIADLETDFAEGQISGDMGDKVDGAAPDPFGDAPMSNEQRDELLRQNTGAQNRVDEIAKPGDAPPPAEPPPPTTAATPEGEPAAAGEDSAPGQDGTQTPTADSRQPTESTTLETHVDDLAAQQQLFGRPTARGALLSLSIAVHPPQGSVERVFRYLGAGDGESGAALDLTYADRTTGQMFSLVVAAAVLFLCWLMRGRTLASRIRLAILLLAGPLALMTIAPVSWLPLLDGLFLGGVAGAILWAGRGCCHWCAANCKCCLPKQAPKSAAKASLILFAVSLTAAAAHAEEQQPAEAESRPAAEAPPLVPVEPSLDDRPYVVIPYEAGTDPSTADRVYLPFQQFLRLWNKAHPEDRRIESAPIDGMVSEALYAASLSTEEDEPTVNVTARYVVHNLRDGQVALPLPLGQVAVTSSTLDGQPAPLSYADGSLKIVLSDPGPHVLDVEFQVPARMTGPAGQFTLPLRPVPAGRLSFTLPAAENLTVRVNGGAGTYRLRDEDGASVVETPIARGGDVTLAWQPRTMRGDVTNVVEVEAATAFNIDDAGLHVSTGLLYRVRQGVLNDVSFTLPVGLNIQKIVGPDVGGWELNEEGQSRILRVFLRRAIEDGDQTSLVLNLYRAAPVADDPVSFELPQIVPQDATHETGRIALYTADYLSLRVDSTTGLSQTNLTQFTAQVMPHAPAYVPELAHSAYRYISRPATAKITVTRREPETRATAEHGARIGLRKQILASRIEFNLSGAPRPAVSLALPEGYLATDVAAAFLSDWYITDPAEGPRILTIELDQPRTGRVEVLLQGQISREPGDAAAQVTLPQPLDLERLNTTLAVWIDSSYEPALQNFDGWKTTDPSRLSDRMKSLEPRAAQFAFTSDATSPGPVVFGLTRAVAQLAADSISLIVVSDTSIDYGFTFRWKITRAAADTFVVTGPDWLSGLMEFTGEGIRRVTTEETEDGRVRWTLSLLDPVRGEYLVTAVASLPPPEDDQVLSPDLVLEQPASGGAFAPLEAQTEYAVLVNLSGSQLTPVDADQIDPVSRDELPLSLRDDLLRQAVEIVRIRDGKQPMWSMQRLQQADAATATVTGANLTSVLEYDGSYRMQAVYTIRNRGHQFLALHLPEDSRVLSVFVRGVPSRTVKTTLGEQTVHLIALPQTSAADLSFDVKLVLAGRLGKTLPESFHLTARELSIPAPRVVSREEAETAGRPDLFMPVVQTVWSVLLPEDLDASPVDDTGRTNVNFDVEAFLLLQRQRDADIDAFVKKLRDPFASYRQKAQALSSLKQLNVELQGGTDQVFQGEQQQREMYRAKTSEQIETINEAIAEFEATDGDSGTIIVDESQSMSEQTLGRRYVIGNNTAIIEDNPVLSAGDEEALEGKFNFLDGAQTEAAAQAEGGEAAAKEKSAGRSDLKRQLMEQSVVQEEFQNRALTEEEARRQLQDRMGELDAEMAQQEAQNRLFGQPQPGSPGGGGFWGGAGIGGGQGAGMDPNTVHNSTEAFVPGQTDSRLPAATYMRDDVQFFPDRATGRISRDDWPGHTIAGLVQPDEFAAGIDASGPGPGAMPTWTAAGGLSLPIDIPRHNQELTFSKVGGEPKLTLALRPRRTLTLGFGVLWTLLWIVGGIWAAIAVSRASSAGNAARAIPRLLIALGLIGFFLVPGPLRWLMFVLFVLGAAAFAWQRRPAA